MMQAEAGKGPSTGRITGLALAGGLLVATMAQASVAPIADEGEGPAVEALIGPAADLDMRYGRKRSVRGGAISERLSRPVRAALNEWAEAASRLDLQVAVGERAECVVFARCDKQVLAEAVAWVDDAWDILEPVRPEESGWQDATLVFLFDQEGVGHPAWRGLFDELTARGHLTPDVAERLAADPGSLTLRAVPAFVQTTWDLVGDAAAGDDEFRLANEVAHKLTQCVMNERFGQAPETLRWGMGYVVEQRLFRSIYQFNGAGFVASSSHEAWPKKAAALLTEVRGRDDASLARWASEGTGGSPGDEQLAVWAALDYMTHSDPEGLARLLTALGGLQRAAVPYGFTPLYRGDEAATAALLEAHLGELDLRAVAKHIKRVK